MTPEVGKVYRKYHWKNNEEIENLKQTTLHFLNAF